MYLPRFIYELLPLIYLGLALFGIFTPETYGRVCGALLILASISIIRMRRAYRRKMGVEYDSY